MQKNIYRLRMDAMSWCFANGYKIMVMPIKQGKNPQVKLNVVKGNKIIKHGTKIYNQDRKLSLEINNIYVYLYRKFNKLSFS